MTERPEKLSENRKDVDPRVGQLITDRIQEQTKILLAGFPCDEGVAINNGRQGAASAPAKIRDRLKKLTPDSRMNERHTLLLNKTCDYGDIKLSGKLERDQIQLGDLISEQLKEDRIPVIMGGGHETSFGHFLGYVYTDRSVSILNIDAHTDVRPLKGGRAHSGSPFRQALEHPSGCCQSYHVFGLSPSSVSAAHAAYIEQRGGTVRFNNNTDLNTVLRCLDELESDSVMVTMDMDAVEQGAAPGVSAPAAEGISSKLWLELAYQFGKHPKVTSFDLCEVNPKFDRDGQTIRLAALTIWYFLRGVAMQMGQT